MPQSRSRRCSRLRRTRTLTHCLKKAHSIRIVMTALLERIQMVTEEKAELDAAIKDLLPPPAKSD
jgi:hypothetical protein